MLTGFPKTYTEDAVGYVLFLWADVYGSSCGGIEGFDCERVRFMELVSILSFGLYCFLPLCGIVPPLADVYPAAKGGVGTIVTGRIVFGRLRAA